MTEPAPPAPEEGAWELDVAPPPDFEAPPEEAAAPIVPPPAAVEAPSAPPPPHRILEAFLFVGGQPLTMERAAEAIRGLTAAQFHEALATLTQEYQQQGRPYTIVARDHGFVLTLKPRFRPVVEQLYGAAKEARLSQQAIDVLALVAYRQPATRQEIESLRGAESASLLRQLVRRGLVAVVGRGQADQRGVTYGTTPRFLELFGLRSLEDLPQTQDLQRL